MKNWTKPSLQFITNIQLFNLLTVYARSTGCEMAFRK